MILWMMEHIRGKEHTYTHRDDLSNYHKPIIIEASDFCGIETTTKTTQTL